MKPRIPTYKPCPEASDLAVEIVQEHYPDLRDAGANIAWATTHKVMACKGRALHCKILRQPEAARYLQSVEGLVPVDVLIVLPTLEWHEASEKHRQAMVDFALCHLEVQLNADGFARQEADGRPKIGQRREDFSGFKEILARHGLWDEELQDARETFAEAVGRQGRLKANAAEDKALLDAIVDLAPKVGSGVTAVEISAQGPGLARESVTLTPESGKRARKLAAELRARG